MVYVHLPSAFYASRRLEYVKIVAASERRVRERNVFPRGIIHAFLLHMHERERERERKYRV